MNRKRGRRLDRRDGLQPRMGMERHMLAPADSGPARAGGSAGAVEYGFRA